MKRQELGFRIRGYDLAYNSRKLDKKPVTAWQH